MRQPMDCDPVSIPKTPSGHDQTCTPRNRLAGAGSVGYDWGKSKACHGRRSFMEGQRTNSEPFHLIKPCNDGMLFMLHCLPITHYLNTVQRLGPDFPPGLFPFTLILVPLKNSIRP